MKSLITVQPEELSRPREATTGRRVVEKRRIVKMPIQEVCPKGEAGPVKSQEPEPKGLPLRARARGGSGFRPPDSYGVLRPGRANAFGRAGATRLPCARWGGRSEWRWSRAG